MATTSAPDESLFARGRSDPGAAAARTEELFSQYRRTVAGLCRALLRDPVEAEDATQQTFLSAHRALLNGGDPREPAAWLATIARNECWARIKARMREPLPTDLAETEAAPASDPVAEALRRADLAALWRAIDELPRVQRQALLLREFGGLSYDELAAALAVSGSAVESLLFRARRRLRAAYAAVTGASWLDALARLVAGGAPAAAKVAALGVGAAAVGSGAVVVPRAFDNHHPSQPPKTVHHHVHQAAVPVLVERAVAPPPVTTAPRPALPPLRVETRRSETEPVERRREGGDDRTQLPQPMHVTTSTDGGGGNDGPGGGETTVSQAPALPTSGDGGSGDGGGGSDDGGGHDGGGTSGSDDG